MRLLIAYDGSDCARAMLDDLHQAWLPEDCQALVLSAVDAWSPPAGEYSDREMPGLVKYRQRIEESVKVQQRQAEEAGSRLRAMFPGWTVECKTVADSPAWAIIKHAEGNEGGVFGAVSDLVVVGSHGHGAVKRLLLGSVSHKVVTQVRCSTRIARPSLRTRGTVSPSRPLRIIVGADGSAYSAAALDSIAGRRWPAGTEVIIVTADESGVAFDPTIGMSPLVADERWSAEIAQAAAKRLQGTGLKVRTFTGFGMAHHVLLEQAESEAADCLFVGVRGMKAIERVLFGSVSSALALHAPCSVEIVHPKSLPA